MFYRLVSITAGLVLLILLSSASIVAAGENFSEGDSDVDKIVESMSPEERVGQLFVVTFQGATLTEDNPVYGLVERYGIGGVVLAGENDNFDDRESVVGSTRLLITSLQQLAVEGVTKSTDDDEQQISLPLLVGIRRQGGVEQNSIDTELTFLPSPMAIGATWDLSEAAIMGEIAGFELDALGINLQLGPALDVLENPSANNPGDPGMGTFGGNAYWVGELGREYVAGVHRASKGRIAFVGESFPGLGAGDRGTEVDIPTVNKSLQALFDVDLLPYFTLTKGVPGDVGVIDALMPAQGRFSAWQGAVTTDTRPLALDSAALGEVMRIPQLSDWRDEGGVIISPPLGRRGVRRYYDPSGNIFRSYEIARDALLAGNDLLFVDEFEDAAAEDQYVAITETISGFVRKYREDAVFAERVDSAVKRVVSLKLRLYGNDLSIENVLGKGALEEIGRGEEAVFSLARKSVTLLSPSLSELGNRMPRPPARLERIVIFTDSSVRQQCSECFERTFPGVFALENAIARLYGFGGSGQISSLDVFSFTFLELEDYLDARQNSTVRTSTVESKQELDDGVPTVTPMPSRRIQQVLPTARWLVFALGDIPGEQSKENALRRLLADTPELLTGRNVIVFALGEPYYLDATEVAQLTAYYGLYGRSLSFVEVAARVLFQEIIPHQSPPIAVEAVSYDLQSQLEPDAGQSISVFRVSTDEEELDREINFGDVTGRSLPENVIATATSWAAEEASEGSAIVVQTSVLVDRKGHVVPDGTLVEFDARYLGEGGLTETFAVSDTVQGIASATLVLDRIGLVDVIARAGDAESSALQIAVQVDEGETLIEVQNNTPTPLVATMTPTVIPTMTPVSTLNESVSKESVAVVATAKNTKTPSVNTVTPTSTHLVEATPLPESGKTPVTRILDPRDLLSGVLAMVVLSGIGWSAARIRGMVPLLRARFRLMMYVIVGVWAGYDYYALQLPGADRLQFLGGLAPALFAWTSGILALLVGLLWPTKRFRAVKTSDRVGAESDDDGEYH